jgi:hypothetical protein
MHQFRIRDQENTDNTLQLASCSVCSRHHSSNATQPHWQLLDLPASSAKKKNYARIYQVCSSLEILSRGFIVLLNALDVRMHDNEGGTQPFLKQFPSSYIASVSSPLSCPPFISPAASASSSASAAFSAAALRYTTALVSSTLHPQPCLT